MIESITVLEEHTMYEVSVSADRKQ